MNGLQKCYAGKKVLVTGHTGFKGAWLSLWLSSLGAEVHGYSLDAPTITNLFDLADVRKRVVHHTGDVRNLHHLSEVVGNMRPDFVFHLAAQSLVRESYLSPVETVATNVMGTVNLLESIRTASVPTRVVVVTSDKCYDNREWIWGYRENDRVGGSDPYSMSKGAAELVVSSWRKSFFSDSACDVRIATARAGNVIGGGDWAKDRIVVDCMEHLIAGTTIAVRNPRATRPWQHVLEPLSGYLLLGRVLDREQGPDLGSAWNFGPAVQSVRPVSELVETLIACWGQGAWNDESDPAAPHEARLLSLSWEKAYHCLGWQPVWDFKTAVELTVEWYRQWHLGSMALDELCLSQIDKFTSNAKMLGLPWTQQ